jgi:hypothetical protein
VELVVAYDECCETWWNVFKTNEWILWFHLIKCYGSWWMKVVYLEKNVVNIVEWMVQNTW